MPQPLISSIQATVLGVVEGITEFLPISSTGHLILVTEWMGLDNTHPGVNAFQIVIQAGALAAVFGIYLPRIRSMLRGLFGRDTDGLELLKQLFVGFLPAAILGLAFADWIKQQLFAPFPVILALAAGGVLMIAVERRRLVLHGNRAAAATSGRHLTQMTLRAALLIGLAQCLAMWPGTSRSMVTMVAALVLGFTPRAAAEFSFLLALPTLGGATVHDLVFEGPAILEASGWFGLVLGFTVSCAVAWLAVKGLLYYLTNHGMEIFGWYRLALALIAAGALT